MAEGRSIECDFHNDSAQIAAMNRTRWSVPDQWLNRELAKTQDADAKFIVLADHHFDQIVDALKELLAENEAEIKLIETQLGLTKVSESWPAVRQARAAIAALDREIGDNDR